MTNPIKAPTQMSQENNKRKSWELFVVKEWLLLPFSVWAALTCKRPYYVHALMENVPEQNKIKPYKIIMAILEWRSQ